MRTVHLIEPGGTCRTFKTDQSAVAFQVPETPLAPAAAVRINQYQVAEGVRLYVALAPGASEADMAKALLRPEVWEARIQ